MHTVDTILTNFTLVNLCASTFKAASMISHSKFLFFQKNSSKDEWKDIIENKNKNRQGRHGRERKKAVPVLEEVDNDEHRACLGDLCLKVCSSVKVHHKSIERTPLAFHHFLQPLSPGAKGKKRAKIR